MKRGKGGRDAGAPEPFMVLKRLAPSLWPAGETLLQLRLGLAVGLILGAKALTVVAPLLYKRVVDDLSAHRLAAAPLALVVAYGLARLTAQAAEDFREWAFAPVAQRAIRVTAVRVLNHVHALSMRFHMDRQTGSIVRAVERGVGSVEMLLEIAAFNIIPTAIEILAVSGIVWRLYDFRYAVVTFSTMTAYLGFTTFVTGLRVRLRREVNRLDVEASMKAVDGLLNYETVKYFANERLESAKYEQARRAYERASVRSQSTLSYLNIGEGAIIAAGLSATMIMSAASVAEGKMTVGDFVLVNSYILQLYAPLNALGTVYRAVRQSMTDIEAMYRLLDEPVEIKDRPNAVKLTPRHGHVAFNNVTFAYDPRRTILNDVSFEIPPNKTVAIVGPSGSGKSTLARLLFRFYDAGAGCIAIDGQDIRAVTQESLRLAIGVVPQDTVLLNESIFDNIAYGRPGANRAEVEAAARIAQIHDMILCMPDGYDTRVGERGLKLSGGEKQRIAIARVILKNPAVLVLDEATSALDSQTEAELQASLRNVARNRSTLIIAHRLSTVVEADEILVLRGGEIVERGRHEALLAARGRYAAMWLRQARTGSAEDGRPGLGAVAQSRLPAEGERALDSAGGPMVT